jgi:hypothetical protein
MMLLSSIVAAADSFGNTLTDALVECPQLKILTLNNMTVSDYKVFERILQGSPKLTNINFDNVHCKNDVSDFLVL